MNTLQSQPSAPVRRPQARAFAPSLESRHAECELNYARLARVLPGFACGTARTIGLRRADGRVERLEFTVTERSPYTVTIELLQCTPVWGSQAMRLIVRAYLDARMAEVTGCDEARYLLARYPYPNARMFARDEKWQLNRLLGEWLAACLADGHQLAPDALPAWLQPVTLP